MFSWNKRNLEQAAKNREPAKPAAAGHTPKATPEERKIRDRAVGQGRRDVNKALRKKEQTQCSESGCDSEAVHFDDDEYQGTCEHHTPSWWEKLWQ